MRDAEVASSSCYAYQRARRQGIRVAAFVSAPARPDDKTPMPQPLGLLPFTVKLLNATAVLLHMPLAASLPLLISALLPAILGAATTCRPTGVLASLLRILLRQQQRIRHRLPPSFLLRLLSTTASTCSYDLDLGSTQPILLSSSLRCFRYRFWSVHGAVPSRSPYPPTRFSAAALEGARCAMTWRGTARDSTLLDSPVLRARCTVTPRRGEG
ncbi:hypothetical protein MSAN_02283800 [Mycena sanguinolenta]|uniref:Uncharacterized protein n=1 Tax=Mycena sanguinolenta TaxID=230812 RepID=A0A8H6X8R2_9AGAR|nr:hypothetical protein MSAN_02283800 [Mycena sanguinolenta]